MGFIRERKGIKGAKIVEKKLLRVGNKLFRKGLYCAFIMSRIGLYVLSEKKRTGKRRKNI